MKRIKENSSTNLNDASFEALKPLFGTKGNPPYYDPNDLHEHIWKKGKLGIEDNPKIPTYSKAKMAIRECVYCKICHKIKDSFQSTICDNKDIINDMILYTQTNKPSLPFLKSEYKQVEIKVTEVKVDDNYDNNIEVSKKIFHKPEGIFDNYITID